MTWIRLQRLPGLLKCAAVFVAHFVCAGTATAEDVTFRSADNAVEVTGEFIAFDGNVASVSTATGPVSFRTEDMACEGVDCPDLENYVPNLRLVGAPRIADRLLPALIDVYARDRGWSVSEDVDGFQMSKPDGTRSIMIGLVAAPHAEAFSIFSNHGADGLLSMRELRKSELDAAFDAGLGRLNLAQQGRILALDALVPVSSPTSPMREISLADLTAALAGQTDDVSVHLPQEIDGQLEGFEDRFMRPFGLVLGAPDVMHSDNNSLLTAVEEGSNAISLMPYGTSRDTQPLALSGPCGLRSVPQFLTLKTEDYPLTFPMFLYLPQRNQHPQIVDFLDWLRSPSAQLVIRRAGFVDLAAVPIPLAQQGDRVANAILSAGTEIPLAELQRMMRLLTPRVRMSSTFRFEPGSTRLDGQSRSNVMQLAQAIRDGQFGGRELILVGFSDGRGPATANRDLSSARAEAVEQDLTRALGGSIPRNVRIETDAFGEALPMACDDTIWGQQTNRRVELWVRDAG